MPITLRCVCGKTLRVPDTSAGKRVKCPACSAIIDVPPAERPPAAVRSQPPPLPAADQPSAPANGDVHDAYQLQSDGPATASSAPVPLPRKRTSDSGGPHRRRRRLARNSEQRGVYIGCGALAVIAGTALALIANSTGEVNATKVIVAGVIIAVFGLVSVIQGITGKLPDDREE